MERNLSNTFPSAKTTEELKKGWAIQGPFCDSFIRKTAVEEIKKTIRKERARNGLNVVVLRSFQTTTIDTILKLPVLV